MSEQIRYLVSVRSRLVDEVLDYLNSLIKQASDLPYTIPEKLYGPGGESAAFESLWQERQLITDQSLYQKWIAEEKKRLHEAGQPIPSSINTGWNQNEISERRISSDFPIINWNEAAHEQFHHAIVVGGPGMGKSWLLRHEAQLLAKKAIKLLQAFTIYLDDLVLPILLPLETVAELLEPGKTVADALVTLAGGRRSNSFHDLLREKLQTPRGVVLLDGIDQVPAAEQARILRKLGDYVQQWPEPRLLLTTRKISTQYTAVFQAQELSLLPLQSSQVESFVTTWFEQNKASLLLAWLHQHAGLNELCCIPGELANLCQEFSLNEGEALKTALSIFIDSPYPGLKPFNEELAEFFYGREKVTQHLFTKLQDNSFLAIIGPSGSGKSSLVFAGLVPLLRRETNWALLHFQPGKDPFVSLASAYVPILEPEMSQGDLQAEIKKHARKLAEQEFTLAQILGRIYIKNNTEIKLLLIIDQFEELLTVSNHNEQRSFIDQFLTLLDEQCSLQIKVLITLRSDFLNVAIDRGLASKLNDHQYLLGAMSREELNRAIEEPANKVRIEYETGLVSRILDDVGDEPGKLPLLQFALSKLYEEQRNKTITFSAYEKIGKVEGALSENAQNFFKSLTEGEQDQARKLYMRLVKRGVNNELTRTPVNQAELLGIDSELIQKIASARLIVIKRLEGSDEIIVELAHEALISHWPQYRQWLQEHNEFYSWVSKLRINIQDWQELNQDEGALLRGAALEIARMWVDHPKADLTEIEANFIHESISLKQRLEKEQEESRQKEIVQAQQLTKEAEARREAEFKRAQEAKRSVRRLRFAFLSVFFLFAGIIATTWAILQFQRAQVESNVKNLSFLAQDISEQNPTLALLLATESLNIADTTESFNTTLSLNINSKGLPGFLIQHPVENGESITAEWSNDGTKIFTISSKELRIWDAENSQVLATFTHETDLEMAKWNPTDEQILVASKNEFIVWDWQTNNQIFTHGRENLSRIFAILWNNDGSEFLSVDEISITIGDIESSKILRSFTNAGFVTNIEWSKDNSKLLMTVNGTSQIFSAETGQILQTFGGGRASWNRSESLVYTVGDFVQVWDASTGERLNYLPIRFRGNQHVTWHSDTQIQIVSADSVQIYDARTSEPLYRLDTPEPISQAYWNPKQDYILTVDRPDTGSTRTGLVWVWNSENKTEAFAIPHESGIVRAEWSEDGKRILTIHENGSVQIWEVEANSSLFTQNIDGAVRDAEVSPSGEYIFVIGRKDSEPFSNSLHVFDFRGNELMSEELGLVTTAKWDEHGRYILLTVLSDIWSQNYDVQVWDAFTGQVLYSISTDKGIVTRVEWDKENDRLLTISNQQYQVWDLRSAIIISSFESDDVTLEDTKTGNEVTTFLTERFFTPQGDLFWEQITKLNLDLENEGTFNSDKSFYIEPFGNTAFIYDSVTNEKVGSLGIENSIVDASFHPEKENILMLTTSSNTHVYKYNIRSTDGASTSFSYKLFTLAGGNAFWSEQGDFIVTFLGSVNVFDSESGELLHAISVDNSNTNHVSRIDNNILIGTEKGMVALIPYSRDGLLEISCNRLVRNFTQTEWQNYFQDEEYRKTCENLPIHSSVSPKT